MSQVSTGLNNPFGLGAGVTKHYKITYDSSLATADGKDRANGLLANCEADFTTMDAWFSGINLPFTPPISLQIVTGAYAKAGWGPPITLQPGNGESVDLVRYLVVSEVTEMLMKAKDNGWGYSFGDSNEGSKGEALSRYLGFKFMSDKGLDTSLLTNGGVTFFVSNSWLSTDRADFVNNNPDDNAPDATTGCTTLFLYYLVSQLQFDIVTVVNNGAATMAGVYSKLTADIVDPFPFFNRLVGSVFPDKSTISTGPNFDNPFPVGILSVWVDKSTFGRDEVQDIINTQGGVVSNAFWVVLEGFSVNAFNAYGISIPALTGSFTTLTGITISPSPSPGGPTPTNPIAQFEDPSNFKAPQRIRFSFDIKFTSVAAFPGTGGSPVFGELDARAQITGNNLLGANAAAIFELLGGANPYFTSVDPTNQGSVFYLSQDLRVFPVTAGTSVLGSPPFTSDPYASMQALLGHLNSTFSFTSPSGSDALSGLPGQSGYETADSSVFRVDSAGNQYYNFALGRVRLRGSALAQAQNVRVFFRLWVAQSFDADFNPSTTYKSVQGSSGADSGHPVFPQASGVSSDPSGQTIQTIPFFAASQDGAHDYDGTLANGNIRTIQIPDGADSVWAYFGCFLDVFDASNNSKFGGTHHCIVAEIACSDAPIPLTSPAGVVPSPANWDQLAQRNLQITRSENPKSPATHVVPQAFDMRPSTLIAPPSSPIRGLPDEFMIDWGSTPPGSTATMCWPQVNVSDLLSIANQFYGSHTLIAVDPHTLQCTSTKGFTFVPIPFIGRGTANFAGLFTVTLPTDIKDGQEFNILVRRISSHLRNVDDRPSVPAISAEAVHPPSSNAAQISLRPKGEHTIDTTPVPPAARPVRESRFNFVRQTLGAFQVKIPVSNRTVMLLPETYTLATLKWRLQEMDPAYRWYPVVQKYASLIAARVDGLGGSAVSVPPILGPLPPTHPPHHHAPGCVVGRVSGVCYDGFGCFDGFLLCQEGSEDDRKVKSHDRKVEGLVRAAWLFEWVVEVRLKRHAHHRDEDASYDNHEKWMESITLLRAS